VQTYDSVDYQPDVLSDDPQLRVAWTLTRRDTGEVVATGSDQELRADVTLPGADPVPEIELAVRVERQLTARTVLLFQSSRAIVDRRYIDRSHPYVRWVRGSVVPWVRKEQDKSLTPLGLRTIERVSAIHRTDVPNSCLFIEPQGRDSGTIEFTYFDRLPVTDLVANRRVLCDYCFFGGPDKTEPLPLPS
jgi:hypothetical protein